MNIFWRRYKAKKNIKNKQINQNHLTFTDGDWDFSPDSGGISRSRRLYKLDIEHAAHEQ